MCFLFCFLLLNLNVIIFIFDFKKVFFYLIRFNKFSLGWLLRLIKEGLKIILKLFLILICVKILPVIVLLLLNFKILITFKSLICLARNTLGDKRGTLKMNIMRNIWFILFVIHILNLLLFSKKTPFLSLRNVDLRRIFIKHQRLRG